MNNSQWSLLRQCTYVMLGSSVFLFSCETSCIHYISLSQVFGNHILGIIAENVRVYLSVDTSKSEYLNPPSITIAGPQKNQSGF